MICDIGGKICGDSVGPAHDPIFFVTLRFGLQPDRAIFFIKMILVDQLFNNIFSPRPLSWRVDSENHSSKFTRKSTRSDLIPSRISFAANSRADFRSSSSGLSRTPSPFFIEKLLGDFYHVLAPYRWGLRFLVPKISFALSIALLPRLSICRPTSFYVIFRQNLVTGRGKNSRYDISHCGATSVPYVQRAGGVGGDKLDHHLFCRHLYPYCQTRPVFQERVPALLPNTQA